MNTQERIENAFQEAEDAFWAVVAEQFPEAKTGDFPFDAITEWQSAAQAAIKQWLGANTNLLNVGN